MTHAQRAKRRKAIAEAVKAGRSAAMVARDFGVSMVTVSASMREYGAPGQPGRRGRPPKDWTLDALALMKKGYDLPQARPSLGTALRIVALLRSGAAQADIARRLGVTKAYVWYIVDVWRKAEAEFAAAPALVAGASPRPAARPARRLTQP